MSSASPPSPPASGQETRLLYVSAAFALELFTIVYMVFEASAALGIGLLTRSVSLQTFGIDSLIEIASALVLLWRLNLERRGGDSARVESIEHRAERFAGWSLLALAAYVLFQSISSLIARNHPESNIWGVALAAASLVVMPLLAKLKLRYADRIGSRALHADAFETLACAYLSLTLLLGLGANYLLGWWWADSLAALAMLYFIVREALEALAGQELDPPRMSV
jgi:divalent metal cation (Fe/Co/Zn/Cd) transporter